MNPKRTILLAIALTAGGLAGTIWVSQGQDATPELTILAPKKPAVAPTGTATSAAAPAAVSAASGLPGTVPIGTVVAWLARWVKAR